MLQAKVNNSLYRHASRDAENSKEDERGQVEECSNPSKKSHIHQGHPAWVDLNQPVSVLLAVGARASRNDSPMGCLRR
jgi:hypothetical protein